MKGKDILRAFSHINERTINLSDEKTTLDSSLRFKRYSLIAASIFILVVSGMFLKERFFLGSKLDSKEEYSASVKETKEEFKEEAKVEKKEFDKSDEASNVTLNYNNIERVTYEANDENNRAIEKVKITDKEVLAIMRGFHSYSVSDVNAYFITKDTKKELYKIQSHVKEDDVDINVSLSNNKQFIDRNYTYVSSDIKTTYIDSTEVTLGILDSKEDNEIVYIANFTVDGYHCYVEYKTSFGDIDLSNEDFEMYLRDFIEGLDNNIDVIKEIK